MVNDEDNNEGEVLTITEQLEIQIAKLFHQEILAALASRDATLRELRMCFINKVRERCRN